MVPSVEFLKKVLEVEQDKKEIEEKIEETMKKKHGLNLKTNISYLEVWRKLYSDSTHSSYYRDTR